MDESPAALSKIERWRRDTISGSGLFDENWYRSQLPGDADVGEDPIAHYVAAGFAQGLSANAAFDPEWYKRRPETPNQFKADPLLHYIRKGGPRGVSPHPKFDAAVYAEDYPESLDYPGGPLGHYLYSGVWNADQASNEATRTARSIRWMDPRVFEKSVRQEASRNFATDGYGYLDSEVEAFDVDAGSAFEEAVRSAAQGEFVSPLAIENAYLKSKHVGVFKERPAPVPTSEEIADDPNYDAVREYLQLTAGASAAHLVLTNDYPNHGDEYANGFVHQRVQAYRSLGNEVDVVSFKRGRPARVSRYDDVPVLRGYVNELVGLLAARTYRSISVHFLNPHMWNALLPYLGSTDIHVFVHGYEIRHWTRTVAAHSTPKALSNAINRTHQLQAFWHHVVTSRPGPVTFIFVSEWMRNAAQDGMDIVFPEQRVAVVHNYIDTELFHYVPKSPHQRFNILWLRTAHAHHYGADLAVRTLRQLRDSPHWHALSVRIIGGGEYFQQFFDEFDADENVDISETFVPQAQISEIHQQYGLFLVPTRLDSQGVSRDEAMASGLVPVTNAVTAVPEFVDDSCAVLAPPEDSVAMARGIEELLDDPARFSAMSHRAAQRVRGQSSAEHTILREARVMGLRVASQS